MVLLRHLKPEVIQALRRLILEDEKLQDYKEIFDAELSRGLNEDTFEEANIKSIITHVNKLPNGKEEGQFFGLDFSGPTIKVMLVKLENRECTITRKLYEIPEKYKSGKSEKLFKFIAKCIANFLRGLKLKMARIPLGVTIGFPIEQTSLQDCKLLRWTKGFHCDDLIGKNIFLVLKDALRKFSELKNVYVIGILNDSVSAVLACAWQDPNCMIGAVIGAGASCCYAEKVHRVSKYETENYGIRDIYINLESADLGDNGALDYLRSEFDRDLDSSSKTPGKQINDKLTSTEYLGEIARLALLKCISNKLILGGEISDKLQPTNSFKIQHMARIESDPDSSHEHCREVLLEFGYEDVSDEDCFQVQFLCRCVSRRSANLVAAQLTAIIERINIPAVTIAADGFLITDYPNFKWYLEKKIKHLIKPGMEFFLREAEESGLGPAVMAALYGEEIMNRDEKLRRLPGFPMVKCHFLKKDKCTQDSYDAHPCDMSNVNPLWRPIKSNCLNMFPPQNCGGNKKPKNRCGGCRNFSKM